MSTIIIPKRRQERRNTAAALAALNEVLLDGEWCIETDTGKTKLGDGVTAYNSLRYLDTNLFAVASGPNTITATFASKPVLYDGLALSVRAAAANTGAATFNPNSLGALAITKQGGTALAAGDIAAAGHELILRYVASVPRWELLNPKAGSGGGSGDVVGPASSVDGRLALFDGTTGKLLKQGAAPPTGTNTGDQTITLTGDVAGSGTGSFAATIANDAVTYAKMQNVSAASRLLGRGSAGGSGDPQELTLGSGLVLAGTVLSSTGTSAPIALGTSNPGSPSTYDLFYRTDLGCLIYYDGARWLTMQEYQAHPSGFHNVTATTTGVPYAAVDTAYTTFLTRWVVNSLVTSGNNGSNKWVGSLHWEGIGAGTAQLASFDTGTTPDTNAVWTAHTQNINALLTTDARTLFVRGTKTGAPGSLYLVPVVFYRRVIP